jgi:hypothetical protein
MLLNALSAHAKELDDKIELSGRWIQSFEPYANRATLWLQAHGCWDHRVRKYMDYDYGSLAVVFASLDPYSTTFGKEFNEALIALLRSVNNIVVMLEEANSNATVYQPDITSILNLFKKEQKQ